MRAQHTSPIQAPPVTSPTTQLRLFRLELRLLLNVVVPQYPLLDILIPSDSTWNVGVVCYYEGLLPIPKDSTQNRALLYTPPPVRSVRVQSELSLSSV